MEVFEAVGLLGVAVEVSAAPHGGWSCSGGKAMSASGSDGYVSAHDPLCLASGRSASWEPEMCICEVIAQVREDERAAILAALRGLQEKP